MSRGTVAIGLLALAMTACGGLGNPGDDATGNPFNTTTAVPPWMGSESGTPTTGGSMQGAGSSSTSGVSESASSSSGAPTTGDATGDGTSTSTSTSSGDEGGPPKLALPPSLSTGNDEDKDKDKDKDKDVDTL